MIEIGRKNLLQVVQRTANSLILSDGDRRMNVSVPSNTTIDQEATQIEVFVFLNKDGVLSATLATPYAEAGQYAYLKVVDETPQGVYLNLGIEKDLFVPLKEQRYPLIKGRSYVVYIYLDELNNQLVGSTKLRRFIDPNTQALTENQQVDLLIYEETDLGYNAIIDQRYEGLLYANEVFENLRAGNRRTGWIKKIYPDGKVDLSLQELGYGHVLSARDTLLEILKKRQGHLPLGDKSNPEDIYELLKMSKKVFKKAVGALYKERLVTVSDDSIQLL